MNVVKISSLQLIYLMSGYVLGTAMILGLGQEVKQDAWIFTLMGMGSSIPFMWVFTQLSLYYPGDSLIQIVPKVIGKYLSYPIIFLFIFHFTYSAARGCRELGELIISTMLTDTPILVTIGCFMLLMVYCLRGGMETLVRMSEILFPIYIFALLVVWVLLFSVEEFSLNNLRPILENGIKPVLKGVVPNGINFPFGETIVIMMFFPFLRKQKDIRKIGISIILIGGLLLALNTVLMISVLGAEQYSREIYKLLSTTQMVSIAEFLERFDILVIILMVSGVFFKVGGFTFAATLAISQVFKLKQSRSVVLGLAPIIMFLSLVSAESYVQHLEIGFKYFIPYLLTFLQLILPIFLLFVAIIRKKWAQRKNAS